jgi:hypothetical protein
MTEFSLFQATGLSPEELSSVLQKNPRAYMAVRGAVSEKHLENVIKELRTRNIISWYKGASGDMDKDFELEFQGRRLYLECKNVEVIKTSSNKPKLLYLEYLASKGGAVSAYIDNFLMLAEPPGKLDTLTSKQLNEIFSGLPQNFRESGLVKYEYSSSLVNYSNLGQIPDKKFIEQFESSPLTIDFQRTRNSSDDDNNTAADAKKNRFYRSSEIDIVAACLFSRTMEWKFLYASTINVPRHHTFTDRYSNRLSINANYWTSNIEELLNSMTDLG